jgi:hypothetical protein
MNATCVRAVHGASEDYPLVMPLDPPGQALPMVLSLAKPTPEVGHAGLGLLRTDSHLTCSDFLAHLGTQFAVPKRWHAGRHDLDGSQALAVVWQKLSLACARSDAVVLALPSYLAHAQAELVRALAVKQRIPLVGSLSSLLAAALAGYAEETWSGSVLAIDIDDHALSVGLVRAADEQARLVDVRHYPNLGLKVWQDRLINALADSCVLQCRRDPREVPLAEQAIFEQLEPLLDAGLHGRMIQLGIQAENWYENLLVRPEQTAGFCGHLARQVIGALEDLWPQGPAEAPTTILLTSQVGRLPGLAARLRSLLDELIHDTSQVDAHQHLLTEEDFGEGLYQNSSGSHSGVAILAPEALARAAHGIGAIWRRGKNRGEPLAQAAPVPTIRPVQAGPARLHFQGQDFLLSDPTFVLGSQIGCHLLFDNQRFPIVAPRHCEILFDQRDYSLHNRSRAGTLVNDAAVADSTTLHPGDWIRLGPEGPLVRFLGHTGGKNMTA